MVYVLDAIAALLGLLLILGAYRRLAWLVDPPLYLWPYYSQAFLKRCFGPTFVTIFTYVIGVIIVVAAIAGSMLHLVVQP